MTLAYCIIAWSLGILAAHTLGAQPGWWGLCTLLGAILILCGALFGRGRWQCWARWAAPFLAALLLGGWRMVASDLPPGPQDLAAYNDTGGAVAIWGWVSDEPSPRGALVQLQVRAEWLDEGQGPLPVRGRLLLQAPPYPAHTYGERVLLQGKLETPPILQDFDYREYLASQGVGTVLRRPQMTVLSGTRGNPLLRVIYRAKAAMRAAIARALPDPEAGLLAGILLGAGHTLPADLADAFRLAGLSHLIVISGYNISLVALAVMALAERCAHRSAALWVSLAGILLFALLVGPTPPVVRAAWMGGLAIVAQLTGRRSHALTSLAVSSLAMTVANPLLLWSASFQLSLAATLALITLGPALSARLPVWGGGKLAFLRDLFLTTFVAQVATLPLIWAHFQRFSPLALLTNLFVLPVQPALMALGFATMVGSLIWLPLGHALGWLAWPLLRYTLGVAELCAHIPWAAWSPPHPAPWLIWLAYAALLVAVWRLRLAKQAPKPDAATPATAKPSPRWAPGLILAIVIGVSSVHVAARLPDGRLHIYVLDVGQGDAILVRTPAGGTLLVDGGPDPTALAARIGAILPFWQRRVDLVIATHADGDHLSGLLSLAERYQLGHVLEGPLAPGALADAWHAALQRTQMTPLVAIRGTHVAAGPQVALDVLHPANGVAPDRADNAQSLALRLTMGQFSLLLAGDVDADTERNWLAAGLPVQATALKVAHHGSASGSSAELIRAADPQIALISVGADNRYGHPAPQVIERLQAAGAQVYRTDLHGTIEIITDGRRCWIKTQRGETP